MFVQDLDNTDEGTCLLKPHEPPTIDLGPATWPHESWILASTSWPLVITHLLQYSLSMTSIFVVGRLGTTELGAISLGTMTINITGYAVYQGLATSLDTLCAQAYGAGNKKLVGLHFQRMVCLLWVVTIPIGLLWIASPWILSAIVPEKETAKMAGLYLQIMLLGAPGWAAFDAKYRIWKVEAGKKYVQAQGIFSANLRILCVLTPLNIFFHWLFVWNFQLGFIGAPIAVALIDTLLPISLLVYVRYIAGLECWDGLTTQPFANWGPMTKLAIPGLVMIEAEWLAFEVLTLTSSYLGADVLAAQSIVMALATLGSQVHNSLGIAASTRVANLIGAGNARHARLAGKVAIIGGFSQGLLCTAIFVLGRSSIPTLFSNDGDVSVIASTAMPVLALFQLQDALVNACNGVLRGVGRQEIGGYASLMCYYLIGLPLSYALAWGLGLGFVGLWIGPSMGSGALAVFGGVFLLYTSWDKAVEEAKKRGPILVLGLEQ